jgi:hypothetical protein
LRLLDSLDELIGDVELYLERTVKVDDADTFYRLRSIPAGLLARPLATPIALSL